MGAAFPFCLFVIMCSSQKKTPDSYLRSFAFMSGHITSVLPSKEIKIKAGKTECGSHLFVNCFAKIYTAFIKTIPYVKFLIKIYFKGVFLKIFKGIR